MDSRYASWASRWRVPLGFALGVAYLVFCQPNPTLLAAGAGVAVVGLLLRGYAAGHLEKNQRLTTGGPYRLTRNPLYLGSLLMGCGLVLAGGRWELGLAFLLFFLAVYWPVMRREEAHLRRQFGDAYARYAARVPFFFPVWRRGAPAGGAFTWGRYRKNREYEAAFGYAVGMLFLVLKMVLR